MIVMIIVVVVIAIITIIALSYNSGMIYKKVEEIQSSLADLNECVKNLNRTLIDITEKLSEISSNQQASLSEMAEDLTDIEDIMLNGRKDEKLYDVAKFCIPLEYVYESSLKRHFSIGYRRSLRILNQLYGLGIIGPAYEHGKRKILITEEELEKMRLAGVFNRSADGVAR